MTAHEREVLVMIACGLSDQQIAMAVFVGETMVKSSVGRIFAELGAHDRAQAVIAAYESGLGTADGELIVPIE